MLKTVAEIGINHNGNLNIVKKLIATASSAGIDYVKFQKRTIDLVYSEEDLNKPRESPWGTTTREQKEGLEFGFNEYKEIDEYCKLLGIGWFASPWDSVSVDFLSSFNNDYIKVPSALMTDKKLLSKIKLTSIPVIASTGMCTEEETDFVVQFFGDQLVYLLHCTSTYPCRTDEINLRYILSLKHKYPHLKIGFSNHSPGIIFIPSSFVLGAEMVEFHITLDRTMYGSDQASSIEPVGIINICKYLESLKIALGDGKKIVYDSEKKIMEKLRRWT